MPGKDYVGSDIKCWKNGEPLTVAQAACARDPNCGGYVQVQNANGMGWSGACTKSSIDPSKASNNSAVTLYHRST